MKKGATVLVNPVRATVVDSGRTTKTGEPKIAVKFRENGKTYRYAKSKLEVEEQIADIEYLSLGMVITGILILGVAMMGILI